MGIETVEEMSLSRIVRLDNPFTLLAERQRKGPNVADPGATDRRYERNDVNCLVLSFTWWYSGILPALYLWINPQQSSGIKYGMHLHRHSIYLTL